MKKVALFALSLLIVTAAMAQNETSFTGPNPSDVPKDQAWIEGPVVELWDNGLPNGVNGYSNGTAGAIGAQRTLLADFVVPGGQTWDIQNFTWRHLWASGAGAGTGTGDNFRIVADAGGSPNIGTVIGTANVTTYMEVATGAVFFSRPEIESFAEFDPISVTAGTYWIDHFIIGPENNFQLTSNQNNGTPCWANYDDLGGLQSCQTQFGTTDDISFRLGGILVPVELQSVEIE